ncbi:hypothetical protein QFZ80_005467 [Paenibacillus sp. V4I7]|nr:hypothetical protein [Paenibacillus sp. V4I7]
MDSERNLQNPTKTPFRNEKLQPNGPYKGYLSYTKKKGTQPTGPGSKVYIKKGVLVIIIPRQHYETITGTFQLCYKLESALFPYLSYNFTTKIRSRKAGVMT